MTAETQNSDLPISSSSQSAPPTDDSPPAWSLSRRIGFRFVALYFVLLYFPAPLTNVMPVVGEIIDDFLTNSIWLRIDRIVAKYMLRLPGELNHEITGSGDTLFDYVHMFTIFCLAAIITGIWSYVQRNRKEHVEIESAFHIWLRYTLATVMMIYGAMKVVKLQFPTPNAIQLIKTYGDSSPMNLLWTFMGFSTPYTFFAGFMEFVPALLLFFRRTALLGALMLAAVLTNVVLLNFCYDVPVKLFSSQLLVMAILIVVPDTKRLVQFFLQNKPSEPVPPRKPFARRWKERTRIVAKSVFIALAVGMQVYGTWTGAHEYGPLAQQLPLHGAYEVDSFVRDGQEIPALLTEGRRMRYFILRGSAETPFAAFVMMNRDRKFFMAKVDTEKKTLWFNGPKKEAEEKAPEFTWQYSEPQTDIVDLEGTFEGSAIRVTMHKVKTDEFLLMNRGFHWVSEVPFNR